MQKEMGYLQFVSPADLSRDVLVRSFAIERSDVIQVSIPVLQLITLNDFLLSADYCTILLLVHFVTAIQLKPCTYELHF